jgi:hypothetical protein
MTGREEAEGKPFEKSGVPGTNFLRERPSGPDFLRILTDRDYSSAVSCSGTA